MSNRRGPDHFSRRAQREGFAARSVYKLEEIDRRFRLFKRGQRVLDLGCAPGSWVKYAVNRVGPKGVVIGIDRKSIQVTAPNLVSLEGDIYETPAEVFFERAGGRFDVITSDMAPDTTGDRFTDHVRSVDLCRRALELTDTLLVDGGAFVCKVFEGGELNAFVAEVKDRFGVVKRVKPKSTRKVSVELFLVAQRRRRLPHERAETKEMDS